MITSLDDDAMIDERIRLKAIFFAEVMIQSSIYPRAHYHLSFDESSAFKNYPVSTAVYDFMLTMCQYV